MKADRFLKSMLAGFALILATGCSPDEAPTGAPPTAAPVTAPDAHLLGGWLPGPRGLLLRCDPMPAASATETIGPSGGVLAVGPHRLYVLPGALSHEVTITATAPSDTVNTVRFEPHGLTFDRSAYLQMSYANCRGIRTWLPKRIVYTTSALDILEWLLSFDNIWAKRVTGRLDHFSQYAVAW